jgi:hypothetical protein
VPTFTSSLSRLAGLRSVPARRLALALCTATALSLAGVTAPAGAEVVEVPTGLGPHTTVGLQPRNAETVFDGLSFENVSDHWFSAPPPNAASFNNPEGQPVLHKNETYAIYWDPTDHYHGDWQHLIDKFFNVLGADSSSTSTVFAVDTQYTDKTNVPASYLSTFRGAYTDTDPYPVGAGNCTDPHPLAVADRIGAEVAGKHTEVCLTDAQIRKELQAFIATHGLEKGMSSIFYLLTPPGVTVCLDAGGPTGHCSDHTGSIKETETESYENSFCSYHSAFSNLTLENTTTPDRDTILYGVIPWTAGGLGDYHLTAADEKTPAYDCQDGGFDPASKPIEQSEEPKEKSSAERLKEGEERKKKEELKEKLQKEGKVEELKKLEKAEEKEEEEREEKEVLEGPHQEEPNQIIGHPGPDGSYDTGLSDLIVSQIGVQQQDIVTDPLLNAWKDEGGNEATDECRNFFAPAEGNVGAEEGSDAGTLYNQTFDGTNEYINDAFNLAALRLPYPAVPCIGGINLVPQFTSPNTVNTGELVGFDGMESDITLNADPDYSKTGVEHSNYAVYKWNFGDGSPEITGFAPGATVLNSPETSPCAAPWLEPCAASTFHSYQYGGPYNVTLTVIDTGGYSASVTNPITVVGPAPPSPPAPPAGGGPSGGSPAAGTSTAGSAGSSGSSGSASPVSPPLPGPVASAAAVSRSLSSVLKKGLVISYSVNEQVAGQFQVLLASSIAKRIGLHGAPATDMPAGSAPSIVIGKAILVTTKGGRGSLKIQFGKKTAAKLRKLRSVTLTIRLVVRNASSRTPLTTTVISTVTLSR